LWNMFRNKRVQNNEKIKEKRNSDPKKNKD
jgi:hypothetical protein